MGGDGEEEKTSANNKLHVDTCMDGPDPLRPGPTNIQLPMLDYFFLSIWDSRDRWSTSLNFTPFN